MRNAVAGVLGLTVAAFALVVHEALLSGVLIGSLVVVGERLHAKGRIEGGFGIFAAVLAAVCVLLLVGYALLITQQFVLGSLAVAAFLAAAWLSGSANSGADEPDAAGHRLTGN